MNKDFVVVSIKKKTMSHNKDHDAQFKNISRLIHEYLDAGKPVLRMDTKKKEALGNFYRAGVTDAIALTIVNDHDFYSRGNGKVIPHGIYDLGKNKAVVYLNTSKDTSRDVRLNGFHPWMEVSPI